VTSPPLPAATTSAQHHHITQHARIKPSHQAGKVHL
jgi:hypothetical protein